MNRSRTTPRPAAWMVTVAATRHQAARNFMIINNVPPPPAAQVAVAAAWRGAGRKCFPSCLVLPQGKADQDRRAPELVPQGKLRQGDVVAFALRLVFDADPHPVQAKRLVLHHE